LGTDGDDLLQGYEAGGVLYARDLVFHSPGKGGRDRYRLYVLYSSAQPEYFFRAGVETVIADLVLYPKEDEDAAGQACGEAEDIQAGEQLIPLHISQGGLEIVPEHNYLIVELVQPIRCHYANTMSFNMLA